METRDLTDSEWKVMECLWEKAPQTAMDLVHQLENSAGWAKSTTMTMVRRMEHKGLISAQAEGRTKWYQPCIQRQDAVQKETQSFLHKVYQGSLGLMVHSMVEQQALSQTELDELYRILKQAEEKK